MSRKQKKKFRIIKDTREKAGYNFRASSGAERMLVRKLDTGDYSLEGYEHLIMVERKSISDLWGSLSIHRERFMKEMDRALEYPARFLVVEGTVKDIMDGGNMRRWSKVTPEFIMSSLIALQVRYGIHVIFTSKRKDVAQKYVRKLLAKLFDYCERGVIK